MVQRLSVGLCSLIIFLACSGSAIAQTNPEINYQGKLTDATGSAVPDGTYNMRFWLAPALDTATTSPSIEWTEEWLVSGGEGVQVTNGLFSIMLGSTTALTGVDFNQTLYLGVEIGSTTTSPAWDGEMSPRKILGSVPAAFEARRLGGVASSSFLRSDQADTASGLLTLAGGASTTDLVVSGTATTTNLVIGGDNLVDLTGTGLVNTNGTLSVSSSSLNLDLDTDDLSDNTLDDLASTSLADPGADQLVFWDDSDSQFEYISTLDGLSITGNTLASTLGTSITESELNIAGGPTDGYVLQASSTAVGGFVWAATSTLGFSAGDPSLLMENGSTTYLIATQDNLGIGTTTTTGRIAVDQTGTTLTDLAAIISNRPDFAAGSISGTVYDSVRSIFAPTASLDGSSGTFNSLNQSTDLSDLTFTDVGDATDIFANGILSSINPSATLSQSFGGGASSLTAAAIRGEVTNLPAISGSVTTQSATIVGGDFVSSGSGAGSSAYTVNSYGVRSAVSGNLTTTGTTAHYGVYTTVGGTADNNYGLYINAVADATNNFALYSAAAASSYLAGNLGLGSTTPNTRLTVEAAEDTALIALGDSTNNTQANLYTGTTSPDSRVTAPRGSLYIDTASGALYQNIDGTTGWNPFTQGTTTHSAKMTRDTAQSISSASLTKVLFDTVEFDTGGIADATTNDRFDIVKAGTYLVHAYWGAPNMDANEDSWTMIYVNGASIAETIQSNGPGANVTVGTEISEIINLEPGDYVEMYVQHFEGSAQNTLTSNQYKPRMSVTELAPAGGTGIDRFTDSGDDTYLTSESDNLLIGTSTNAADAKFVIRQQNANDIVNIFDGTTEVFTILDGGNVGIGTTSPWKDFSVAGDVSITGALFDSTNSAGANGSLLMSTISGTQWMATNTLNIALDDTVGILGVTRGGTGLSSVTTGDLLYASGVDTVSALNAGSNGQVLWVSGGEPAWVATSSLGIQAGASSFLSLTDVSVGSFTDTRILFQSGSAVVDSADFAFNDTTDTLTVGGMTLADGLFVFSTSTRFVIPNNTVGAFSIGTTTSGTSLFSIDTTAGTTTINIGSQGDVYFGSVGSATNVIFEESSLISGQGENTITLGESGDTFAVGSGVKFGVGTSSPVGLLSVNGEIYLASTTPTQTTYSLYNLGGALYFNGSALNSGGDSLTVGGVASSSFLRSDQADTASGLLTFTGGFISNGSSTISGLTFGTATGTTLVMAGDTITDFTGTGLSVASGLLSVGNLATSSLNVGDTYNPEYVLQASSTAAGGFVWVATSTLGFGGGSLLTDGGATTYLTSLTDKLAIGTTTASGFVTVEAPEDSAFLTLSDSTNNTQASIFMGTTSPDGRVTGDRGSLYIDTASGQLYQNIDGTTDWNPFTQGTTTHMAKMTRDVAQTILNNTYTKIAFDTIEFDTGGIADATTNDRFDIKKAGVYLIHGGISFPNIDAGEIIEAIIDLNGTRIGIMSNDSGGTNFAPEAEVSRVLRLEVGDYLEFYTRHIEGASQDTFTDISRKPFMSVTELAPAGGTGIDRFTDSGDDTYLTSESDNLLIGTSTNAADAKFVIRQQNANDIVNIFDGTTEVFTILDGGNVGIGTTSPWKDFSVAGDVSITGALFDSTNSAGANGSLLMSTISGTQWMATNTLNIALDDTVGILGVTRGGTGLTTFGGSNTILYTTSADTLASSASFVFTGSALGVGTSSPASTLDVWGDFRVGTSSVPTFMVDPASGRVGIGTSTDYTSAGLTLYGTSQEIVPGDLTLVGSAGAGTGTHIEVVGDIAFVSFNTIDTVRAYDITDPTNPTVIGSIVDTNLLDSPYEMAVAGDYLYVGSRADRFVTVIDITEPKQMAIVGTSTDYTAGRNTQAIEIAGNYLYAASPFTNSLTIFDISNPLRPVEVSTVVAPSVSGDEDNAWIQVQGNYVYATFEQGNVITIFDVSDPFNPVVRNDTTITAYNDFAVQGQYLYVQSGAVFQVYDIGTSTEPVLVATTSLPTSASNSLTITGNYVYLGGFNAGISIVDISQPLSPRFIHRETGTTAFNDLQVRGNYVYVAGSSDLRIYEIPAFKAPAAEIGSLLAGVFEAQTARVRNLLTVDGSLNVGQNAFVQGSFAVGGSASSSLQGGAPSLFVNATGVGLGTTSPDSLLTMDIRGLDTTTASVAGIDQYFTLANSVEDAVQYGNRQFMQATNTATTTLVGNILRLEDSTTFGNTTRGFEVQVDRGVNTLGENTALSGFARTFGVRGTTRGDAGGDFEPAGGFFETEGVDQGNAIRGFSDTIENSELLQLFQTGSAFTGTGLLMSFGNGGGSFASTSSKFVDFQNAQVSKFTISAQGTTTIGDGTVNNAAGVAIGYGGLCVDDDGTCTPEIGRIAYVSSFSGNSDLAENYFSSQDLLPGELVKLKGGLSVERATSTKSGRIIGVVSTKPGVLLGSDDTSLVAGEVAYPIALSGRVPVRISDENGEVTVGDPLMLSSIPGVAMKATGTATIVGFALEGFDGDRAYSDTFINQFGDDIAEPVFEPININDDPRINDGCYFGAGDATDATSTTVCQSEEYEDIEQEIREENLRREAEALRDALADLAEEDAEELIIDGGEEVRVGQIVMFVNLSQIIDRSAETTFFTELFATSTVNEGDGKETLWDRLRYIAQNFVDGVLAIAGLKVDRVEVADELCIDGVCVTGDELRSLLNLANQPMSVPVPATSDEIEDEEPATTDIETPPVVVVGTTTTSTSPAPVITTPDTTGATSSAATETEDESEAVVTETTEENGDTVVDEPEPAPAAATEPSEEDAPEPEEITPVVVEPEPDVPAAPVAQPSSNDPQN